MFKRVPLPAQLCNLGRLIETLEQRGLDGVVAYLRPNVLYLSGFAPPSNQSVHETNAYAAVVISRHAPEQPVIVVAEFDLAYFLSQPSWIADVRPYATLLLPLDVPLGPSPLDRFIPQGQAGRHGLKRRARSTRRACSKASAAHCATSASLTGWSASTISDWRTS